MIKRIQISKLKLPKRKISRSLVNELVLSIRDRGLMSPIGIDSKNRVTNGMHRLLAMKKLGKKVIPCIIQETEAEMAIHMLEQVIRWIKRCER